MYYMGVDGGGTSCRARLTDGDGKVLGQGQAGSANPRVGLDIAWDNINAACLQAAQSAGLSADIFADTQLGLGLAGVAQQKEQDLVLAYQHDFSQIYLLTDAHAACLGAFSGQDGAILILGTGSCGLHYRNGEFRLFGGWGFPVSDHGSGAWLGLMAIRRALLAQDGIMPNTPMTVEIMTFFQQQPSQVVAWQDQAKPKDYASFAPKVFQYADQGDEAAIHILEALVADVTLLIQALLNDGAEHYCLMGGISEVILPWLNHYLLNKHKPAEGDAMDGALLMAKLKLGYIC